MEVPKTDEDGNPIEVTANSTQVQVNATSNTTTANATLAQSNSSIKANGTNAAKTNENKSTDSSSSDSSTSEEWDSDIVQTKDQKTAAGPVPVA